jgi:hypothetical protein
MPLDELRRLEMQHVFEFLAGTAPKGDAGIRRLADSVRLRLGLDRPGSAP